MNDIFLKNTINFLKEREFSDGAHDIHHCLRVLKIARHLTSKHNSPVNLLLVEIGALFHDIIDHKFDGFNVLEVKKDIYAFLAKNNVNDQLINSVFYIMDNVSYSVEISQDKPILEKSSIPLDELFIVQDADRLDALGSLGIARTFAFGGFRHRKLFDGNYSQIINQSQENDISSILGVLSKIKYPTDEECFS
jgi:uncharacterized protein